MVLLLTDVFLLLTQVLLWIIVGLVTWFALGTIPGKFLTRLVLLLILIVLVLTFLNGGQPGPPGSVLEIIWRIISFPLSPFGLGLILLWALMSGRKMAKWLSRTVWVLLTLLVLSSLPYISNYIVQELEFEAIELVRAEPVLPGGARRVIVLLGQDTTRAFIKTRQEAEPAKPPKVDRPMSKEAFDVISQLPVQLSDHGNRLIYAAQLYREESQRGTNPLLVVSAGEHINRRRKDGEKKEDVSESSDIQRFLTRTFNIPQDGILLEHDSFGIQKSAENVKKLLVDDRKINFGNQLTVIDSAMSMNRTALTFSKIFDEAIITARPTDFHALPPTNSLSRVTQGRDQVERQIQATDFLPNAEAFWNSSQAIQEYLNSFYYFLRGWIKPLAPPPQR